MYSAMMVLCLKNYQPGSTDIHSSLLSTGLLDPTGLLRIFHRSLVFTAQTVLVKQGVQISHRLARFRESTAGRVKLFLLGQTLPFLTAFLSPLTSIKSKYLTALTIPPSSVSFPSSAMECLCPIPHRETAAVYGWPLCRI